MNENWGTEEVNAILVAAFVVVGLVAVGFALYGGFNSFDGSVGLAAWYGFVSGAIGVLLVCIAWALFAWPLSEWNRNNCAKKAEGYGLDGYDWSYRYDCRLLLPTGQFVPAGSIRITSDGRITAVDE